MSHRCPSRPAQVGLPGLLLLLTLVGPAALAQLVGPYPKRERLTSEQLQKVFPEQRRLALQDHRARLAILQRGEACLQNSENGEALRNCMRVEREAMRQQRRQQMESLKALYQRNGLPAPPWMQRKGRASGAGPDWGGSEL